MPVPAEYLNATRVFEQFLVDARDEAGLPTTNMAWNMVAGVLLTFRRRLSIRDALRFADVLPPGIRALFVADWDVDEPILDFPDRQALTREVQSLRAVHNWSPDTAIENVAVALRRQVNDIDFDRLLSTLPAQAQDYWQTPPDLDRQPT